MLRRALLLASLLTPLALPSLATAQRGGGARSQSTTEDKDMLDVKDVGPTLRVRDVEDASPLKLLIDKRKDLKLTDDQLKALKDRESKMKDKNTPLLKAVDSLLHASHTIGAATDVDRNRVRNAQTGLRAALDDMRANYDAAAKDAIAPLDPAQQAQANDLVARQREDADKMWHERMVPADKG
jgi:hypothetical protein